MIFVVAGLVLATAILWLSGSAVLENLTITDLLQFGVIILVIGFAVFVGIKRFQSMKRGEPAEDELSRKILRRTASVSFYISLYLWVFMLFLIDRVKMDTEQLLGTGILGMAIIYALTWVVLYFRGIRND